MSVLLTKLLLFFVATCLCNSENIRSVSGYKEAFDKLKKDTDVIGVKKQKLGEKVDAVRYLKKKLDTLEIDVIEEENKMAKEQDGISKEEKNLEKKINVMSFMRERKVGLAEDLMSEYKTELSKLQAVVGKLDTKKSDIKNKMKMSELLKKNGVNSIDELENMVKKGAEEIRLKQSGVKNKLDKLSASLESDAQMDVRK